ncbi:hypothetical protein ILYODFUR_008399 [Ilyodon furcidens]|uniref:Uncharacterized protein n=1 Tax=Ilyodon furcidens TaxID=33524 RepID=A0ABV0VFE4_9TELE
MSVELHMSNCAAQLVYPPKWMSTTQEIQKWEMGYTVAQLVALLPCSKKVLGSIPGWGSFCMEFACSPRACVGSHRVLRLPPPQSKDMSVRCRQEPPVPRVAGVTNYHQLEEYKKVKLSALQCLSVSLCGNFQVLVSSSCDFLVLAPRFCLNPASVEELKPPRNLFGSSSS